MQYFLVDIENNLINTKNINDVNKKRNRTERIFYLFFQNINLLFYVSRQKENVGIIGRYRSAKRTSKRLQNIANYANMYVHCTVQTLPYLS